MGLRSITFVRSAAARGAAGGGGDAGAGGGERQDRRVCPRLQRRFLRLMLRHPVPALPGRVRQAPDGFVLRRSGVLKGGRAVSVSQFTMPSGGPGRPDQSRPGGLVGGNCSCAEGLAIARRVSQDGTPERSLIGF